MLQALLRIRRFCRSVGLSEAFFDENVDREKKQEREKRNLSQEIRPAMDFFAAAMYLLEEIFKISEN